VKVPPTSMPTGPCNAWAAVSSDMRCTADRTTGGPRSVG
jgi:hypothetical protein